MYKTFVQWTKRFRIKLLGRGYKIEETVNAIEKTYNITKKLLLKRITLVLIYNRTQPKKWYLPKHKQGIWRHFCKFLLLTLVKKDLLGWEHINFSVMAQTGYKGSYTSSCKSKNLTYLMYYIYHTIYMHHYNSLFYIKSASLFYFCRNSNILVKTAIWQILIEKVLFLLDT